MIDNNTGRQLPKIKEKSNASLKKYAREIASKYDGFKNAGGFINISVDNNGLLDVYHTFTSKEYQSYCNCTYNDAVDRKILVIRIDEFKLSQKEALKLLVEAVYFYQKKVDASVEDEKYDKW